MTWVVKQYFNESSRKYIKIDKHSARKQIYLEQIPINSPNQVVDRQCWCRLWWLFVQTNDWHSDGNRLCAIFSQFLYLYSYEHQWLTKKYDERDFESLKKSNFCFRYLDDFLCINNDQLVDSVMELELTSDDAVTSTHYLDLDLKIVDEKISLQPLRQAWCVWKHSS